MTRTGLFITAENITCFISISRMVYNGVRCIGACDQSDLVTWTHHPIALFPSKGMTRMVVSGTALEVQGQMFLFYTAVKYDVF